MKVSRLLAAGLASIALAGMGSTGAWAGEVTGTGEDTQGPAHANSICVYSGLNDDPAEEPGKTQNYGQIVRSGGKAIATSPGDACNGHTGILAGGGGEE
jgi:hypothetical protein